MKKRKELSVEQLQSLVMNGRLKKFVSIEEGALLYSVGKNLIALCKSCHSQIHAKRGDFWGRRG
jgi:hypothetical protein